jgi:hypothetical protein
MLGRICSKAPDFAAFAPSVDFAGAERSLTSPQVDLSGYTSRMVHTLMRVLDQVPDHRKETMLVRPVHIVLRIQLARKPFRGVH